MTSNKLSKIDLSPEATPKETVALITTGKGIIIFGSEVHPLGGPVHNNALYLTVTYLCKYIPLTLVDKGSTLNVCT